MNEWAITQFAKIRGRELEREIQALQMARATRRPGNRKTGPDRGGLLFRAGQVLVAWGLYLQKRYQPKPPQDYSCC
ncbi:MAG: hypothetical protein AB1896_13240 [Thermodesulfobacteriota bacterium]